MTGARPGSVSATHPFVVGTAYGEGTEDSPHVGFQVSVAPGASRHRLLAGRERDRDMTSVATSDSNSGLKRWLRSHVRLSLLPAERGRHSSLDGAWWPRSHSLTHELPALIAELDRRGVRVGRVAYHEPSWDRAPGRVMVSGRIIHLGGHHDVDSHVITLTSRFGDHGIGLLVVPPHIDPVIGCRVMTLAAHPGNQDSPSELLAAARWATDSVREGVLQG